MTSVSATAPVEQRPSTVVSVAQTAATNALLGALGIGTGVIAARWLGPEGRGELAAIQMWPSVLASLAMIGLPEAVVYFCAKHPSESRRYLVTAGVLAAIVMPMFAVIGFVLMPYLLSTQSPRVVAAARMYLILVPIYGFVGLPHQVLRGIQRYRLWNVIRIVPPMLWLAVLIVAMVLRISDPARMTGAYLVILACVGPALTVIVWRHSAGPWRPSGAVAGGLVRFGLPSALAVLPQFFNLKLDQMMVAAVVPARELGVYMVAVAWGACIPMVSSALSMVVSTQLASGGAGAERASRFNRGVRTAGWIIGVAVLALGAATPLGVTFVFGRAFQAAIVPAAILVVASGINALNGVLEELLRGCGRPSATLWAEGVAVAVGFPALWLLLPRLGLTGAAVASLIGYVAATALLVVQSRRVVEFSLTRALDPRGIPWSEVPALTSRVLRFRFGQR